MKKTNKFHNVYWCPNCNVPLLSKYCNKCGSEGSYCASDLKPVFSKERKMYEKFLSIKLPRNLFRSRNRIIMDGETLFRSRINFHKNKISSVERSNIIRSRLKNHKEETQKNFWRKIKECNRKVLRKREKEAINFIQRMSEKYNSRIKMISFSGGKDSSVTAILVKKALGSNIAMFFSDTTLEFPETYKFIRFFAKKYKFKLIKDRNRFYKSSQDFFELCKDLGPPSISYRWCCTVFKAHPVNKFYANIKGNILAFDGIRKYESLRRRKYRKVTRIKKIPRQIAAYPIFYWSEADVWFYILINKVAYNPLYNFGHTRVGCWVCPNASPSNCFLRKYTHPKLYSKFEKILRDYAKKYDKPKNWIVEHYWRLRRPKKDKIVAVIEKPCFRIDNTFAYNFKDPFTMEKLEFFKPFGSIKMRNSYAGQNNQSFEIGSKNPFKLFGVMGDTRINVTLDRKNFFKNKKLFEKQLLKAINCVGCGGCIGYCPFGAISIQNNKFTIDTNKCRQCKKCVESSCIALSYKTEQKIIKSIGN